MFDKNRQVAYGSIGDQNELNIQIAKKNAVKKYNYHKRPLCVYVVKSDELELIKIYRRYNPKNIWIFYSVWHFKSGYLRNAKKA